MSNKRGPPQNSALAALRNQGSNAKKLEAQNSLVNNPQVQQNTNNNTFLANNTQQLQQTQEQQQQVPCFDAIYPHRHFFTESGIGSRDGRPVVPMPGQKTEHHFTRINNAAKLLGQFQSSWKTAYADDSKRGSALDGAIVPNSRFPTELSALGQPIRKPKIKLAMSQMESRLLNNSRNRRRQREGEGKDGLVTSGNPNKKKIGGGTGGAVVKGGGVDGADGSGKADGKDGVTGGGDGKENPDLDDDNEDDDDDDEDDDDYSDNDGNDDDDDEDYGGGGDDGELAF